MTRRVQEAIFCIVTVFSLSKCTGAFQLFPNGSVAEFPHACGAALSANVTACSNLVAAFDPQSEYSQTALNSACTAKCGSALASWFSDISTACRNVTFLDQFGFVSPLSTIPGTLALNFNLTCLVKDGSYCNIVLGNETAHANGSNKPQCNECILSKLRDEAQSPYGRGPLVRSESLYESYTSTCKYSTQSLTIVPPNAPSRTSPAGCSTANATPTATCTGTTYSIKAGDTCDKISIVEGIATIWLLMDNQLPAYCWNFPKQGILCLDHKCSVHTVEAGDTCSSVAAAFNISVVQLQSYNPWIDTGCYNFNRTIGTQICVNEPGQKYTVTSIALATTTVATPRASLPTYSMNPFTNLPDATYTPIALINTLPLAPGTRKNCSSYVDGSLLNLNIKGANDCAMAAYYRGLSLTSLTDWNPSINTSAPHCRFDPSFRYCMSSPPASTSNSTPLSTPITPMPLPTTMSSFYLTLTSTIAISTTSTFPSPTQKGSIPSNCTSYAKASKGDTCSKLAEANNITPSQLYLWNKILGVNGVRCNTALLADYYYCVKLSG